MKQVEETVDQRLVKALAHPLRLRLLTLLDQKVASPSELAEELGEPLGNVSYHVRTLAELDCIELVKTTPRRGAVEHHYRAIVRPLISDKAWGELPVSLRRSVSDGVLDQIAGDVRRAGKAGGFDRDNCHLTRTRLALDEQGFGELAELLAETLERAMDIQAESTGRLAGNPDEDSMSAVLVMMLFEGITGQKEPAGKRRRARGAKSSS